MSAGSVTALRLSDGKFAGGALPDPHGDFRVDGLPLGTYTIRVRAMGFAPVTRTNVAVTADKTTVDLGIIQLSRAATKIGPQVVTAEREDVQLAPDRNVYTTKNMTTAAGGTAIDVLRNIPAVQVDASNQVSLRGNGNVVIQINGRASPLRGEQLGYFLQQLPASTIKRVEVAMNPSAKDDPEGTAGIINLVLNQEADIGLSAGVNGGASTNGQLNASANIGRQQGPFTWWVSYAAYSSRQKSSGWSDLTNLAIPVPASVNTRFRGRSSPHSQNGMMRTEYRVTPRDALSLDVMLSGGHFGGNNSSYVTNFDASRAVIGLFEQYTNNDTRGLWSDFDLAYRRTGNAGDRTFSIEARSWAAHMHNDADIFGTVFQGDASTGALAIPTEQDVYSDRAPTSTLQGDFSQPFGAASKLEAGFKEILRHTIDDFTGAYLDTTSGVFVPSSARATSFDYREQIGAAYGLLSHRLGKVQTQAGLRLEEAGTRLGLPLAPADSQRFDNRYASFYPSGVLSYDVTATRQLKLSYSRRVSRPFPGQMTPLLIRQDAHTYFRGNPGLEPQYTDAFELTFQDSRAWGTLQINPYLRRTENALRFIQITDTTGITVGTYDNVASATQAGGDVNVTIRRGPLVLLTGASTYHYTSNASNLPGNLSTNTVVFMGQLNVTWMFSKALDFQWMSQYRAPSATEGGRQHAFTFMNLALRRKLWNDKGSITLRVMDPFNLYHFGSTTVNPRVVQSTVRSFGVRGVFIAFSRNFGQQLKLRPAQTEQQPQAPGPPVP